MMHQQQLVTVPARDSSAGDRAGTDHRPGADAPAGDARRPFPRPFPSPDLIRDRPGRWLAAAMVSLAVLAAAAAVVSFAAQYRMVLAAKGSVPVAGLEAGIPDVAALIFATLGIALALHGRRAIRARVLNVAAVGTSVLMNALAAAPGWRAAAIWVMPPVAYAIASDTLIGVVRAHAIARQRALRVALAEDDATPLAIVGGLLLWLLRLAVAPASTLGGFRAWVVEECPVAPGRRARPAADPRATRRPVTAAGAKSLPGSPARAPAGRGSRAGSKTARFLALVATRHGPLEAFPIGEVSQVSAELAPEVGLNPGAARAA
ncbi:MAG: hypothetical protein ACYCO9_15505, partial [Streptosporangiaceae bacterium]